MPITRGWQREIDIAEAKERQAREEAASQPIECQRCGIELGDGRNKCRRAVGADLCMDCSIEIDPPMLPGETCEVSYDD